MEKNLMPTVRQLEEKYFENHSKSKQLFERAKKCFASGVTHDARYAKPFPIYASKAQGTKKWDVDGNEYVDYVMGHGTYVLGYGNEKVLNAFQEQIKNAIHMGSCTELEIEWAELIKDLVPVAKEGLVRACGCGGEAVMMAARLARIYTGRDKIVIGANSYHGKWNEVSLGNNGPPYGMRNVRGIPEGIKKDVEIVCLNDLEALKKSFSEGEVACFILHCNNYYDQEYIEEVRELTKKYGVVFIMDEVISGFRYALGGAQEYYGITPDLAVLGKVVGGGAPIGAVCGREDIMKFYEFRNSKHWNNFVRISTGGTWNAQPLTIAGGIALMRILDQKQEEIYPRLYKIGNRLTNSFNDIAEDLGVSALATGLPIDNPTKFELNFFNQSVPPEKKYIWKEGPQKMEEYSTKQKYEATDALYPHYLALTTNNIHSMHQGKSFVTCANYSEEDLQKTENAFRASLEVLKENNFVGKI